MQSLTVDDGASSKRHRSSSRLRRAAGLIVAGACALLAGCTATVFHTALTDSAEYYWLTSTHAEERRIFYTDEEKVVLFISFTKNFIAAYELLDVRWYDPSGKIYFRTLERTEFGTHEYLITSVQIRDHAAEHRPGNWYVELWHEEQLLARLNFKVLERPPVDFEGT